MRTPTDRFKEDDGVTLTFVVLTLFLLLGVAALAIDFGIGFLTVRDAQNAAESASAAAALEECNGTATYASPEAAGIAAAAANDFDASDVNVFATSKGWAAEITPEAPTIFLGFFGISTVPVEVVAEASCPTVDPLGGAAIMAETSSCYNGFQQLNLSSSNIDVFGDIISNSNLKISSPGVVDGDLYYSADESIQVHALLDHGEIIPTSPPVHPIPYPWELQLLIDDDDSSGGPTPGDTFSDAQLAAWGTDVVDAGTATIDKTWLIDNGHATDDGTDLTVDPGYYYTRGNIDLNTGNARVRGTNVTFIAEGTALFHDPDIVGNTFTQVDQSGNTMYVVDSNGDLVRDENGNLIPLQLQLAAYSGAGGLSCSPSQVALDSTGAIAWDGILFAPFGTLDFSGASSTVTINGAIFAFQVSSSGSQLRVVLDPPGDNPPFAVLNFNE